MTDPETDHLSRNLAPAPVEDIDTFFLSAITTTPPPDVNGWMQVKGAVAAPERRAPRKRYLAASAVALLGMALGMAGAVIVGVR